MNPTAKTVIVQPSNDKIVASRCIIMFYVYEIAWCESRDLLTTARRRLEQGERCNF